MADNATPGTLRPLPPPPRDERRGYRWVAWIYLGVWVVSMILTGAGWLSIPGFDPTGGLVWWLVTALIVVTPACLFLAILSCGLLALLRVTGARRWPALLQAVPVVTVVLVSTAALLYWLLTYDELNP